MHDFDISYWICLTYLFCFNVFNCKFCIDSVGPDIVGFTGIRDILSRYLSLLNVRRVARTIWDGMKNWWAMFIFCIDAVPNLGFKILVFWTLQNSGILNTFPLMAACSVNIVIFVNNYRILFQCRFIERLADINSYIYYW